MALGNVTSVNPQPWDTIGEEIARLLDGVQRKRSDSNDRDQSYFHPSTVGYCPRKTVLERLKVPKDRISERSQRIFDNGHSVHERIGKELAEAGILIREEVPVHLVDRNAHGHTDGIGNIVFAEKGGVLAILEIKSAGAKGFHWIAGGILPGDKFKRVGRPHGPDKKHIWQVQLYMHMTGITYAVIIYECKDCQERAYFTVKKDPTLIQGTLLPIIDLVNAHVETKTLPPRDTSRFPDMTCFDCTYCDYRDVCEAEEKRSAGEVIDLIEVGNRLIEERSQLRHAG